jgi:hypothetical protein
LQLGEGFAVGPCYVIRKYRLKDTQSLAKLHGPALEFTKHTKDLLSSLGLCLRSGILSGHATEALTESDSTSTRMADWQ